MKNESEGNRGQAVAAFVVSLLAGLWMLASSLAGGMGWYAGMGNGRMMGGMGRGNMGMWMWRHGYMNDVMGAGAWSWIGLALAILVCVAAIIVYVRPQGHIAWGVTIIVGSVIAAATGVGFLPAVLGIVGGILAVTRPPSPNPNA
ncbi:MAG: hypothetical protein R6V56_00900 [Lentisphaeria bacterium]